MILSSVAWHTQQFVQLRSSSPTYPIHSNNTGGGSSKSDSGRPYTSPIALSPSTSAAAEACHRGQSSRGGSTARVNKDAVKQSKRTPTPPPPQKSREHSC